ncbi:hypothetical protein Q5P01_025308 [Channa striata]|uniref:Secreted protein n=1 Tax=Channa striata TaxID=64152 RepID=A0AA88IMB9_CHASR|nr:hypothetical protein Q5P01_025308 [Channa striata]
MAVIGCVFMIHFFIFYFFASAEALSLSLSPSRISPPSCLCLSSLLVLCRPAALCCREGLRDVSEGWSWFLGLERRKKKIKNGEKIARASDRGAMKDEVKRPDECCHYVWSCDCAGLFRCTWGLPLFFSLPVVDPFSP